MINEKIINESNRCIGCVNKPCVEKCPLQNDVTGFIKLVQAEKYKEAFELLCNTTVLQPICGRICPHEKQCKSNCTRKFKSEPIEIGNLESFVGDLSIKNDWEIPKISENLKEKKIAVIGGGPSGLTCAAFLAREGADVTIYEKHEELGGILRYGIPDFRLDKEVLSNQISKILDIGINVKTGVSLQKDVFIDQLEKEYDAIFLAFGANVSKKMRIPGEDLAGVYGANELLEYANHPDYTKKNVFVSGGGNVAIDAVRTIKRLGAKSVTLVYRRSETEMPAEKKEIQEAKAEGINFMFNTNIIKIIGNTAVEQIECVKTEYRENVLTNIEGSNFTLAADVILMAVGSAPETELINRLNLETNEKGNIKIDEENKTSRKKIFAGGDLAGEKATVAWASRSGRNAAANIKRFLLE